MERAWVLITAAPGAADDLVESISAIKGQKLIDEVQGEFDLVVALECSDQESLNRAVDAISQLEGVEDVVVCELIASHRIVPKGVDPGWP